MLKVMQPLVESEKTKCAEIHYETENFYISCELCDWSCLNLPEFKEHFQHSHDIGRQQEADPLELFFEENTAALLKGVDDVQESTIEANTDHEQGSDVDCGSGGDKSPANESIDWSQPYNPNSLRNYNRRPYKPRNKPIACSYCGRIFRRRYQLDSHVNIHTGLKPHQCEICGRQFCATTTLQRHRLTHEERVTPKCQYCSRTFTHRAALVSHEMRHTQERTLACEFCPKLFYTNNQLDTHKRKVHALETSALPFGCNHCEKRYRSASMLSTHKYKKHYKTAQFVCDKCNKKFVNELQMQEHEKIHFPHAND